MSYLGTMEQSGLDHAIARIGSAVARLERALDRALFEKTATGDPEIAAKHEALRQRVTAALSELDGLIGTLEK